jgi:NADPH-dependent ferric siderophore reductase
MSHAFPLHTGIATVIAISAPTPAMTCLTLHARVFEDPGIEHPGEIITLGWAPDGEGLVLPEAGWRFPAGRREQHWRNFTVRRHDPARATIDVDFYLHGIAGHATDWAQQAQIGDRVGFAGPRAHWQLDPEARWCLLLADETGLPALLAILESLPAGQSAIAVAEIARDSERQTVDSAADVQLHWVRRDGRPPGTTTLLLDTIKRLALPDMRGQAWGGGEGLAMRDLRRHLTAEHPALADSMVVRGYWKHRDTPDDAW